jgi:hypothetical protein
MTGYTMNHDLLPSADVAWGFLPVFVTDPRVKPALSEKSLSVDGALIEACASMRSFWPKDDSGEPIAATPSAGRRIR